MNIALLYPQDPLNFKKIDEMYLEEATLMKKHGFKVFLLDQTSLTVTLENSNQKLTKEDILNPSLLYRGWMLNQDQYSVLCGKYNMLIQKDEYLNSHYLPNYYEKIEPFTIKTQFYPKEQSVFKDLGYEKYFVKDYVKSVGTSSLCKFSEISNVLNLLKKYRGEIEGGICIREGVELTDERRIWIVGEQYIFDESQETPSILLGLLNDRKINSPFYSVDVAKLNGQDIIIEINNGQVSDLKEWDLEAFIPVLRLVAQLGIENKLKINLTETPKIKF